MYLTLIFLVFIVGIIVSFRRRLAIYKIEQNITWSNLKYIPKRFFVDVHNVVDRERQSSIMHILIAGGSALIILTLLVSLLVDSFIWVGFVGSLMILVGVVFLKKRRVNQLKNQRSAGDFLSLPSMFIVFSASMFLLFFMQIQSYDSISTIIVLILALLSSYFIAFSGKLNKPLKHIFSGSLNLAFHPRAKRFANNDTALKTIATNQADVLGVDTVDDFLWQQKLNFDACIECGRCQTMCPAFEAGQPLNPKKLIQDLLQATYLSANVTDSANYAGLNHPNLNWQTNNSKHIIGGFLSADTLWSCTTCRACVYECPMMVEHIDAIIDLRRHQTMALGKLPASSAKVLASLRDTKTLSNHSIYARANWAAEFELDTIQPGNFYDILLWIGEAGFELHNHKTLRQFVSIVKQQGISIAILEQEYDCGDTARRLGDEALFQSLSAANTNIINQFQFGTLVTCDPHVYHVFKQEYTNLKANVQHHTEFLNQLFENKKLAKLDIKNITYHDPCYLGRYNDVIQVPRNLLKKVGVNIEEMPRSKYRSRCCGYGGGAGFSDIAAKTRIADMRIADVQEVQATTVITACPNCKTMLDGVIDSNVEVLDIVELLSRSQEAAHATH